MGGLLIFCCSQTVCYIVINHLLRAKGWTNLYACAHNACIQAVQGQYGILLVVL